MKQVLLIGGLVLGAFSGINSAYAGCTNKCLSREPFSGSCLLKVKVCDIGSPKDWAKQAEKGVKKFAQNLQREWHNIYGQLPDDVRYILNTYPITVIGASLGGLEGSALGHATDILLNKTKRKMERTKIYKEAGPEWKKKIYDKGLELATGRSLQTIYEGQATKQHLLEGIDPAYEDFLECADSATNLGEGWDCVDALETVTVKIQQRARRR